MAQVHVGVHHPADQAPDFAAEHIAADPTAGLRGADATAIEIADKAANRAAAATAVDDLARRTVGDPAIGFTNQAANVADVVASADRAALRVRCGDAPASLVPDQPADIVSGAGDRTGRTRLVDAARLISDETADMERTVDIGARRRMIDATDAMSNQAAHVGGAVHSPGRRRVRDLRREILVPDQPADILRACNRATGTRIGDAARLITDKATDIEAARAAAAGHRAVGIAVGDGPCILIAKQPAGIVTTVHAAAEQVHIADAAAERGIAEQPGIP